MPIPINHVGPRFREFKQTPAEKELAELRTEVAEMKKLLLQLNPASSRTTEQSQSQKEGDEHTDATS